MTVLLMALFGGVGAVCRFITDTALKARSAVGLPVGTLVINVTGSFLLGLLTALVLDHAGLADLKLVLGVGLLGGYTTFSTASVEVANLALSDRPLGGILAVLHGASMLVLAATAGAFGLWLG